MAKLDVKVTLADYEVKAPTGCFGGRVRVVECEKSVFDSEWLLK
jgi:hypothetical protein